MPLGAQLPVRLEPDVDRRLGEIAAKSGTTKSALIRLLAKTFVEEAVKPDGSVSLPPNWKEMLKPADGRSSKPAGKAASGGTYGKSVYPRKGGRKRPAQPEPEISAEHQAMADEAARRALREQAAKLRAQQKAASTTGKTS